jgi:hypothetical protein
MWHTDMYDTKREIVEVILPELVITPALAAGGSKWRSLVIYALGDETSP